MGILLANLATLAIHRAILTTLAIHKAILATLAIHRAILATLAMPFVDYRRDQLPGGVPCGVPQRCFW